MRLLHVTHQYWPAIGGSEKYITDVSEALARRGHDINVITTRSRDYLTWTNSLPRAERSGGVSVRRFDSLRRSPRILRMMEWGFGHYWRRMQRRYEPFIFLGSGPISPGLYGAVRSQASGHDVVHINQLHYSHAYTAFVAARAAGRPIVLTPHLHAEQRETWDIGYLRAVIKGSHVVVAVSDAERRHLLSLGLSDSVVVAGNGLVMDNYPARDRAAARKALNIPDDAYVILFLGRKTDYKGLDIAIEAFRQVRQSRPKAVFLAVGPETEFSTGLWARVGEMDGLIRRAAVGETEKLDALAACDVMCMPSTGEAFGITYLEAWAYAKPVIGARIASVASIISENANGLLVEPRDVRGLVQLYDRLIDNPALGVGLGKRGYATLLSRYTIARIAEIIEGAYAIARRRAAA
jgi:glycosyltransferase involved in cell wall biosynthesis